MSPSLKALLKPLSDLKSLLERYGSRGLGLILYNGAKGAAKTINVGKSANPLPDLTRARLEWLFPTVDVGRVRIIQGANLPANWFVQPNSIDAMTFGWEIYMKTEGDVENDYNNLLILTHELVHVRQIRDLGEGEFARRYGEQWEQSGGYSDSMPLENEAYSFASNIPFDPVYYLNQYPDVNAAVNGSFGGALNHWLYFGVNEGRQSAPYFFANAYLAKNADLQQAGLDIGGAVRHWMEFGHAEGRIAT